MFPLEGAFGINKSYNMNNAYIVASICKPIARNFLIGMVMGFWLHNIVGRVDSRALLSRLELVPESKVDTQGVGKRYIIPYSMQQEWQQWLTNNVPLSAHAKYLEYLKCKEEEKSVEQERCRRLKIRFNANVLTPIVPYAIANAPIWNNGVLLTRKERLFMPENVSL